MRPASATTAAEASVRAEARVRAEKGIVTMEEFEMAPARYC